MSSDGEIFLIAAPSGAGKTSLMRALLERCPRLALSVSDTTRPARAGETEGEQYHFVAFDEFRAGVGSGAYLEHACVFGHHYGTRRDRVEALWSKGRDVLLEIDVQGARQVAEQYPELCTIFIVPPSMAELTARLHRRGLDAPEVIERRLSEARGEVRAMGEFRWLVINDEFERALGDLCAIVRAWPLRRQRQWARVTHLLDEVPPTGTIAGS